MFFQEDNTYNDIRRKSLEQWLQEMERHEDVAVRTGIPLVKEYLAFLEGEKSRLQQENSLKNEYLKKISAKNKKC